MYEVRYVDSGYTQRNADELVPEGDMSVDSRHATEDVAEGRRKEIERNDPGAMAWIYDV